MIAGKVVGSLISTRKSEKLIGSKFMIVEPVHKMKDTVKGDKIVVADIIGAGIGEYVLVSFGRAARIGCENENLPIDAAIVGIIDQNSALGEIL